MFLLWLRNLPQYGDQTSASVSEATKGRFSPTNTPVFPPSSFALPNFVWFCIFFPHDQVLLATLRWCSARTFVSECIHRERCTPRPPTTLPSCSPDIFVFEYTLCFHSFLFKEQESFNFIAAVTVCSDFGSQENKMCHCFHFFPIFAMKWWDWMPWCLFFECWVLSQVFHSPLSLQEAL